VRLIADENIPAPLVHALRADGHDVLSGIESFRRASDEEVLQRAIDENRVLLTFDADFGRMIFSEHHPAPSAVIFVRIPPPSLDETIERVRRVVNAPTPGVDGYFVSVDRKTRYHPLPPNKPGNPA
jgi:predicted nuclease of predicted toxin-antitoxin system